MKMKKTAVILSCMLIVFILTLGLHAERRGTGRKDRALKHAKITIDYLNELRAKVKRKAITDISPVMKNFKKVIDNDPVIRMYFTKMIDQVPEYYQTLDGGSGYLKSIDEMIILMDEIIKTAPEFNETDLVGFPINHLLNWTMGVPAGFAAYRIEKVNREFREILNHWSEYLNSSASLSVLNDGPNGWKCEKAKEAIKIDEFQYDPDDKYWGFDSWNDFFTREFKEGVRPLPIPEKDNVIVSACESEVVQIQENVKEHDWFWVKSQPYSLKDMLAKDKGSVIGKVKVKGKVEAKVIGDDSKEHYENYVKPFIDGTVYQAFLSAFKYHRWHSPVSGTIEKAYVVPGTYYSGATSQGMDPASPDLSQGYIAHVAARALIYIKADNSKIGLMCVIPIGMAEVSSCIITVENGQHVKKGDQLGYFLHGGSSHCLVFRPGVIKEFKFENGKEVKIGDAVLLREQIAIAN